MGDLSKNFSTQEFQCPCCGVASVDPRLVNLLQKVRDEFGKPISITSGYRCAAHNKAVGGSETSSHLSGLAVDMACKSSAQRFEMLKPILKYFKRLGIGKDFIHGDCDPMKDERVAWLYSEETPKRPWELEPLNKGYTKDGVIQ